MSKKRIETPKSRKDEAPRDRGRRGRLIPRDAHKLTASMDEDEEPLSKAELRELKRRVRDLDDPIRHMLVSEFSRNFILYYNVSSDTFVMNEPAGATLFKRLRAARAIKRVLGRGISIVKYTTRAGKLKRLSPYRGRFDGGRHSS